MEILIRQAKLIAEQQIAKKPGQLVSLPVELPIEIFKKTISKLSKSKKGLYLVAEVDKEIVAHGLIWPGGP